MTLRIKFTNNTHSDIPMSNLDDVLLMIKHAKLGKDRSKEFDLHVKETGETIRMNHDQIYSVELILD